MWHFLFISVLLFALKGFSYDEYIFQVKGEFSYAGSSESFHLSDFSFHRGTIYGIEENQKRVQIGTVENLNEWTRSYVFKTNNLILSTHRSSLFSLGILFDYLKEYEVYNAAGELIGFIKGIGDTNSAAEFFFYKENQELFAKATLDVSRSKLTITSPNNQILVRGEKTVSSPAQYRWTTLLPTKYYWTIKKEKNEELSSHFLWPFMGFLSEVWWH